MRILITGGTGLVGRRLAPVLIEQGHEVLILSRNSDAKVAAGVVPLVGNASEASPWLDRLDTCAAVFHLAGENLFAKRWTNKFKKRLRDSRVDSTRLIAERMALHPFNEDGSRKLLVTASAVGYYGMHDADELDETSPPGADFLARLCVDWEEAAEPATAVGVRVVHPRFGMVLDREEGALPKMAKPFRLMAGGYVSDGKQWMSWIHITDLVNLLLFILERKEIEGAINATAPEPLTNWGFSKLLGKVLHRPCWLQVPSLALPSPSAKQQHWLPKANVSCPNAPRNSASPSNTPTPRLPCGSCSPNSI